jgi:hypothetical protein
MATVAAPNFVRRQYLAKLPLDELIAMHKESVTGGIVNCMEAPPLREVVEQSDVLVWGKVVEATPNREEITRRIVEAKGAAGKIKRMVNKVLGREVFGPGRGNNIRVILRLEVSKSYPAIEAGDLTVMPRVSDGGSYYVEKGCEAIFALRWRGGNRSRVYNIAVEYGSIYLIDDAKGVVLGVPKAGESRPAAQAWEFMCDLYDGIRLDEQPRAAGFGKAMSLVKSSGEFNGCFAALRRLQYSPEAAEEPSDFMMDAIERFYTPASSPVGWWEIGRSQERQRYLGFVAVALGPKNLGEVGDEESAERMCALYVGDMGSESPVFKDEVYCIFEQIVKLALKFPGPERRGRLERVFKARSSPEYERIGTWEELQKKNLIGPVHSAVRALARVYDEDIEGLLVEMCHEPRRFGVYDSRTLGVVWEALADRGNPEIRAVLNEFVSAPEEAELAVVCYPSLQATVDRARTILGD